MNTDVVVSTPLSVDQIVELKKARTIDERALRSIFLEARTANGFLDRPVPRELLAQAVELALIGPTSANALPMRVVFVESPEAKERLKPAMSPGNLDKTMAAPATAIVATDLKFYEQFPRTFPARGEAMKETFAGMEPDKQRGFAWDNALLQMGYFIIALRALGLDTGPMAGFDRAKVDAAFFPEGQWVSQYLINIGYGDDAGRFDSGDCRRFIEFRRVARDADRADHLALGVADEHAARHRNEPARDDLRERVEELRRPLRERARSHAHRERAAGFADRDVAAIQTRPLFRGERLERTARVEHRDAHRLEVRGARVCERCRDDRLRGR